MQSARCGLRALQRLACTQQQQRCVGSASKLFPDQSEAMGASRPAERGDIGECSGVPSAILKRVVTIYAPARTASQQGQSKTATLRSKGPAWRIDFGVDPKWQNPLIGWTSTGDPLEHVGRSGLNFDSQEAAVAFAEKLGYQTVVRDPNTRRPDRLKRFAGYGDNFSVKRHGYPVGGMRSESPLKKQAATEEMHVQPPDETTVKQMEAPASDEVKPKKTSAPRKTKAG